MENATNPVIFVGAGPGDPELITVAGKEALAAADLIVTAGSLVNPEILGWRKGSCRVEDSAPMNLEEIVGLLVEGWRSGLKTVRLHTGDPSLYGAVHEQFVLLKEKGVPYRVIPGVTAAMAAAAALGLEFTLPEITQTLILTRTAGRTPMPPGEDLASLCSHRASVALYLSAAAGAEVSRILSEAYGPDSPVALVYRATWPDGRTVWTTAGGLRKTLEEEKLDRHTLMLCGPAVAALRNGTEAPKSRLYDKDFSHGYRNGGQ
ncbi:MAG: precorrin-4 C(11)-methyltransferase [Deltaproteobacteria bacterium]|jgi:precorrin-4/cobalt-precorrin-4 C11-methyltransferase|nr:precorrin-4 C(11)-methyltransferase [Deltaproteobacteria bacterium]